MVISDRLQEYIQDYYHDKPEEKLKFYQGLRDKVTQLPGDTSIQNDALYQSLLIKELDQIISQLSPNKHSNKLFKPKNTSLTPKDQITPAKNNCQT